MLLQWTSEADPAKILAGSAVW